MELFNFWDFIFNNNSPFKIKKNISMKQKN